MAVDVGIAKDEDAVLWNRVVQDSLQGSVFHTWKWLKLAEKYSGFRLIPCIGKKGDRVVGIYPLFQKKRLGMNLIFSPPPSTLIPFLGPVYPFYQNLRQEDIEREMVEFQDGVHTQIEDAGHWDVSLPFGFSDPRPFSWAGYEVIPRYDYQVSLDSNDDLLSRFNRNSRRNVQDAKKTGFTAGMAPREKIRDVYRLLSDRYREQGRCFPARLDYLLDLSDQIENLMVMSVQNNGAVISGMVQVKDKDTVWAWIGFPKPATETRPSPNDMLTWEAISLSRERGAKRYVTIGAAGNARLHWYYASKCDPDVRVRYAVRKTTMLASLAEGAYMNLFRPLQRMRGCP